jgi:hypothetical protein
MAAACSSSEAAASTPLSALDENRWNQRRMIKVAKIHHKNHVFSMKEITEPLHGYRWPPHPSLVAATLWAIYHIVH